MGQGKLIFKTDFGEITFCFQGKKPNPIHILTNESLMTTSYSNLFLIREKSVNISKSICLGKG